MIVFHVVDLVPFEMNKTREVDNTRTVDLVGLQLKS
jgi:hypothetical protein